MNKIEKILGAIFGISLLIGIAYYMPVLVVGLGLCAIAQAVREKK